MKEIVHISFDTLRSECVKHDWFTLGTCREYQAMFNRAREIDDKGTWTAEDYQEVATIIKDHSDTEYDVPNIMCVLANAATRWFE